MSSPLKRKRTTAPASSSSSSTSPAASNLTSRRPFAPIFEDSLPSPQPNTSSSSVNGDAVLRAQLESSLSGLRTSARRLEWLLRNLPSTPRNTLTEVAAPPQPISLPSSATDREIKAGCSSCRTLQCKVAELEQERQEHEKERQAWKEFKSWWLASLAQKEKRHKRKQRSKAASSTGVSSEIEGGNEAVRAGEDRLNAVVKKLDASTRKVWARAGIVPTDERGAEDRVEVESGAAEAVRGENPRSRTQQPAESGSISESAGQQSEVTLPLHAVSPLKAIPTISASAAPASSRTRPSSPPIRTAIPRPPTIAPTAPTTTAAEQIGHIDSTPIRNRLQRRTMLAHDCPDCSLFYSHLNANGEALGDRERMACSRHRTTFQRATTPDGYWNIGFPTTQEVEEINASAKAKRGNGAKAG